MMKKNTVRETPYGTVRCGDEAFIYGSLWREIEDVAATAEDGARVALTGGSTPARFYEWARARDLPAVVKHKITWTVSDERMVPLEDEESNFGTADRNFLIPQGIDEEMKFPWPVSVDPQSAGLAYEMKFRERFGERSTYDLCLLGMGDDGHTASIFPGSPLLVVDDRNWFSAVKVPGKGWRLSITPSGLGACGRIRVVVTGAQKAERLRSVLMGEADAYPVQILSRYRDRVEWLVDEAAAKEL
jgi:6-phosphogluconolactonase